MSESDRTEIALANIYGIRATGISDEERLRRYDNFGKTYDMDVETVGYKAPLVTAQAIAEYFTENRSSVVVLDIAAGTGLVGKELKELGFELMDALDPSPGMLEKAKLKNVYRNLICKYITSEKLDIDDNTYDAITLCGGFGHGHVPCEAVHEMIRLVKPGGVIVIVTRPTVFYKDGENRDNFFSLCNELEEKGKWKKHKITNFQYYQNNEEGIIVEYVICD